MNNNTTISQQARELYSKMKSKGAMYETDMDECERKTNFKD